MMILLLRAFQVIIDHEHSQYNRSNHYRTFDILPGRLPESSNIEEFKENLMKGMDMVTEDDRRWPVNIYDGVSCRFGKIKDLESFDASFFEIFDLLAHVTDPQLRILLEVTYEAIVDAGINPTTVRGSRTGIFIGVSSAEAYEYWTETPDRVNGSYIF
jgi:fatty acid synthase